MPFEIVLGGVKAFVVDPLSPMSQCLGLHQIDKGFQVSVCRGNVLGPEAIFVQHPLRPISDPGSEKQLTGRIDLERVSGLKNGYPKLFIQRCGGHIKWPFFAKKNGCQFENWPLTTRYEMKISPSIWPVDMHFAHCYELLNEFYKRPI
jgi:hypothetical protein